MSVDAKLGRLVQDVTIMFSISSVSILTHLSYPLKRKGSRIPKPNNTISTSGDETARPTEIVQARDALVSDGDLGYDIQRLGVATCQ